MLYWIDRNWFKAPLLAVIMTTPARSARDLCRSFNFSRCSSHAARDFPQNITKTGIDPRSVELLEVLHEFNEHLPPVLRDDRTYYRRLDLHVRAPNPIHHPEQACPGATLPDGACAPLAAGSRESVRQSQEPI